MKLTITIHPQSDESIKFPDYQFSLESGGSTANYFIKVVGAILDKIGGQPIVYSRGEKLILERESLNGSKQS